MKWGFPYNPFAIETVEFHARLTPEECQQHIQGRIAPETFLLREGGWSFESFPVWGRVSARGFSLSKRIRGRDSWSNSYSGKFVAVPDGTRVAVSIYMNRFILTFEVAWVLYALYNSVENQSLFNFLFLLVFPFGLGHVFGRMSGRQHEAEEMTQFLRKTLESEDLK